MGKCFIRHGNLIVVDWMGRHVQKFCPTSGRLCNEKCAHFINNEYGVELNCGAERFCFSKTTIKPRGNEITFYLSGAMEKVGDHKFHGKGWREHFKKEVVLKEKEPVFIDPYDFETSRSDTEIVEGDLQWIRNCNIFICDVGHEGCGTWMEMRFAHQQGKRIFTFGENGNPWVSYHETTRFKSIDELITYLNSTSFDNLVC